MQGKGNFHMADVRAKRVTRRRAVAVGELHAGADAFAMIAERRLPKGDALALAEIAGLQGAKQASALMPLCHPLPLDLVRVRCLAVPARHAIRVYCEVATEARTGVEMEALAGVNAALLTIYDLTKPVQPALRIEGINLLFKEGGKSGLWICPEGLADEEQEFYAPRAPTTLAGAGCAIVTLSDRAAEGVYPDQSGPVLREAVEALGGTVRVQTVMADDPAALQAHLCELADQGIRLCLCSGGTGLGPRDQTPEALIALGGREVPGLAELFRAESAAFTGHAWLSRSNAVLWRGMLILALPGSPKAARQALDILGSLLSHALAMAAGGDHR
ncbi:MAG: bifunctional molybdenum cofactor biosynthesis protein MoaC/MoaB [Xanthomonadales bacterium]|nr:bifunctional molybdenum cofactor biosynthesis protein MoaC/MoaB [Xanthomonadales bacterium]